MHFGVVTDEYCAPSPTTRGTAINVWSIIMALRARGHSVTAIIITDKSTEHFLELKASGVSVRTLPFTTWPYQRPSLRHSLRNLGMETFYPWVTLAPALKEILSQLRPDAVLGYNLYNLAALHGVDVSPRMAVLVDLDHWVAHYRWRDSPYRPLKQFARATLWRLLHARQPRYMRELMAGCQSVVNFAAHHAAWLRAHGTPHCVYIPPPTRDLLDSTVPLRSEGANAKKKILLVGHLAGIATISGIRILLRNIIPALNDRLPPNSFEVHVVGDHSRHREIAEELEANPVVRLRGYVEDVTAEFMTSDVLLVPTPIKLGTRTRIIEGFSLGCCIVAHTANSLGIPQMRDGQNTLMAGDGPGLADAMVRALTDRDLNARLRRAARETFLENFSIETAGSRLASELERIAAHPSRKACN